jgi:hypothetical protein
MTVMSDSVIIQANIDRLVKEIADLRQKLAVAEALINELKTPTGYWYEDSCSMPCPTDHLEDCAVGAIVEMTPHRAFDSVWILFDEDGNYREFASEAEAQAAKKGGE